MNIYGLYIAFFASFATVIGALTVKGKVRAAVKSFFLAFASGIMLYSALAEMLPSSTEKIPVYLSILCLCCGVGLSALLDLVLPHDHGHEEGREAGHYIEDCECVHENHVAVSMIVSLVLHNLLEGFAMGVSSVESLNTTVFMALGIAIHNIPIGASLAISIVSAGKSRAKSLVICVLVALSQLLGAVIGMFSGCEDNLLGICFALVAGILVFVCFDELWPAARKDRRRYLAIIALTIGLCVVPVTENFLPF